MVRPERQHFHFITSLSKTSKFIYIIRLILQMVFTSNHYGKKRTKIMLLKNFSFFKQDQLVPEIPDSGQLIDYMQQRKAWSSQEDKAIADIVQISKDSCIDGNLDWYSISQQLKDRLKVYKTPKQCQDRWNHHLKPGSTKDSEWTYEEQIQLFEFQEKLGNKWTEIASKFQKKSDNAVKNFFYATLRKSVRLINNFITQHRHEEFYKNLKTFPENCIGKIIAQDQNKKSNKMRVTKENICESARGIKILLLEISRDSGERDLFEQAILQISQFNRNCRRLRSKKRKASWESSDQEQTQRSSTTHHSIKISKNKNEEEIKSQQSFSIKVEIPKSISKQFSNNTEPNYMFDSQDNIILFPSENEGKDNTNEILTFTKQNGLTQKVCIANLLKRIGTQYNSQGMYFPSLYLNQQFSTSSKIKFDNFMECLQEYDPVFEEAYQ